MNEPLGAVVILYNPTQSHIENIYSYIGKFTKIWLIDNSEQGLLDLNAYFNSQTHRVEILQNGENKGIAKGINFAIKKAIENNYKWLLTMDQDSSFEKGKIDNYTHIVESLEHDTNIALVGVNIENKPNRDNILFLDTSHVITSGTFINLSAQPIVGYMKEELFIDEVDTEYSYRCQTKGWRVVECLPVTMNHTLGEKIKRISLKSGKITERFIHAPVRLYYITRNYLWVKSIYKKQFPNVFKHRTKNLLMIYKNNILYNPERFACLKMIYRGYCDYKQKKFGKLI